MPWGNRCDQLLCPPLGVEGALKSSPSLKGASNHTAMSPLYTLTGSLLYLGLNSLDLDKKSETPESPVLLSLSLSCNPSPVDPDLHQRVSSLKRVRNIIEKTSIPISFLQP